MNNQLTWEANPPPNKGHSSATLAWVGFALFAIGAAVTYAAFADAINHSIRQKLNGETDKPKTG